MGGFSLTGIGLIVDNFAGGGGTSLAIEKATGRQVDIAINHDAEALAMHQLNHPWARHLHSDVYDVDTIKATAGRWVDLAWFSPDCTHHSKARGGKPVSKRVRGLAWVVIKWAARVKPNVIIMENVEEFQLWGPLKKGKPCPARAGQTFALWVSHLRALGYKAEWQELRACDYGAPTSRNRLFLVARRDGLPIVWPEPTHGRGRGYPRKRTAADIIDWSIPAPSIFTRKKQLVDATLTRIAKGIQRYVIEDPKPFIVPGEFSGLQLAHIIKHHTGVVGQRIDQPLPTTTVRATQNQLLVTFLQRHFGTSVGSSMDKPVGTITAGGNKTSLVYAFLTKYYGTAVGQSINDPLHTITTKDRLGLVTVRGKPYQVTDIGMRMLSARELYNAQGFPADYIIDFDYLGKPLTKTAKLRLVGNSVSPAPAAALIKANCGYLSVNRKAAS